MVDRKHKWEILTGSLAVVIYRCQYATGVSLVLTGHYCNFSFKEPYLIGSTGIVSGSTHCLKDPAQGTNKSSSKVMVEYRNV